VTADKPTPEPVGALGSLLSRFYMKGDPVPAPEPAPEGVGDDQPTIADLLHEAPASIN
jgi:hypothetical protein